jgi:ABC-2 type transport system ATP-binding protein
MVQPMPPPVATVPGIPGDGPPEPREVVIEVDGLTKSFGDLTAVDSVSFKVGKGEIFGFFGPNGAGKTTTMRMLTGMLRPTAGTATVTGHDITRSPTRVRRTITIMTEEVTFYEGMTVDAYLTFFSKVAAATHGKASQRFREAVETAEIASFLAKRIKNLSHGQRQKVSIARALLSDVPIMFLDEPFQGIDIIHRKSMREYLRRYVKAGGTVFFTSHNLIEAEHIVDRFAFIDGGRIVTIGTSRELRDRFLLPSFALRVSDLAKAEAVLKEGLDTTECQIKGDELVLTLKDGKDVPRVAAVLGGAGIALMEMRQLGTMEDAFLRMRQQQGGGP